MVAVSTLDEERYALLLAHDGRDTALKVKGNVKVNVKGGHMELVVHCKREPYDVYIGRPSKWGNPFVIGRNGTRAQVIAAYAAWLCEQPELMAALGELRGKVLGCWCSPQNCHGEVLAAMANSEQYHSR